MKAYLFAYSQACSQAQVHAFLNNTRAVKTWVAPFPYSAILVSDHDIQDIGAILQRRLQGAWFIVTEMSRQMVDGWLPENLWAYVNEPGQAWSRNLFEQIPPPKTPPPQTPPPQTKSPDNSLAALLSTSPRS